MTGERRRAGAPRGARRMQLRYGFNEVDGWWHISLGEHRERIQHRLRLMGTQVIRVFVFDQPVPDPVKEWHLFAAYVQAVLDMRRHAHGDLRQVPSALRRPAQHRAPSSRAAPRSSGAASSSGAARR